MTLIALQVAGCRLRVTDCRWHDLFLLQEKKKKNGENLSLAGASEYCVLNLSDDLRELKVGTCVAWGSHPPDVSPWACPKLPNFHRRLKFRGGALSPRRAGTTEEPNSSATAKRRFLSCEAHWWSISGYDEQCQTGKNYKSHKACP